MLDSFGREIYYLRISVTDRCNLRCRYCMPEEGVPLMPRKAMLSLEEIAEFARSAADLGFHKVRLTGGEPLVRSGIAALVSMLAGITGIRDLSMTTNGVLLARYARDLARAGLMRVNVSLDAVDPERFSHLTRGGDVRAVLEGIDAALDAGLSPVKINCVVQSSPYEEDARAVARYAYDRGLEVRFIKRMNLEAGEFSKVEGGSGGDCRTCSRLRLGPDGTVRSCLFSDVTFDAKSLGAREAIMRAIEGKPESGRRCVTASMSMIGG
ncbi:MAG: radical SAM protein [bacterium]|jgi:cyclic pyranopterin phosphate synthase